MRKVEIIGVLSMLLVAFSASAALAINCHFAAGGSDVPQCSVEGDTLVCTGGHVAGVGGEAESVELVVDVACATKSPKKQEPPGHATSGLVPIEEDPTGQIALPTLTVPADCPPGLNATFGDTGTLIFRDADQGVICRVTFDL
jgi:hypothetical protein